MAFVEFKNLHTWFYTDSGVVKAVDRRGTDFQAGESLQDYIERIEEETIRTMFDRCRGNVSQCATCLHMKRQTLQHKLKKYGILY